MRPRIAIIGGGISGLAAAHELAQSAPWVDVRLLESASRLGGVLETTRRDGFLFEAAADSFLTAPPAAVDLCRKVRLEESLIATNPAHRQVFVIRNGRMEPIPEGFLVIGPSRIRPMLKSRLLSVRGKLRMGLECLIPRRRSDEDESLALFVCRRFGREMFDRLVQPLVGGIYAADPRRLSMQAAMPRFQQMERRHGSLIRAQLRRRREPQNDGCGGVRDGQFAALRDGMSSLVGALAEHLPARSIRLSSPVDRITPLEDGRWLLSIGGNDPDCLEADGLIVATPAHRAAKLLAEVDRELAKELLEIEYASCAVISLGYRREQISHPLDGFGFVVPLIEERTILSCSFSSVKFEGRAPEASVLLRVFIGGACQCGLLSLTDDQLVVLAEREVAELLGIRGEPVVIRLTRQRRAMPQYHVGHCNRVEVVNRRVARLSTLALAGSAYGGVGIPACIQSGRAAAERVLSRLKMTATCSTAAGIAANFSHDGVPMGAPGVPHGALRGKIAVISCQDSY